MDWADGKAEQIRKHKGPLRGVSPTYEPFDVLAQALRDVRRETAEEFVVIIRGLVGDEIISPQQERIIVADIIERFNLEGK